MEQQSIPTQKISVNYGLLLGVLSVVLGVILYITNAYLSPHWSHTLISSTLFILFVVLGIRAYKNANGGFLSLTQAIKVGISIALIAAVISSIWQVLLSEVIEPGLMDQMMEVQRTAMIEQNPNMTQDQIDMAMEWSSSFQSPWVMVPFALITNIFFGLIVALIAGLAMRRKRPNEV